MSKKKINKYTYNNNRRGKLSVFFFSVIQNGLSFFFYDVYTLPHTRPQETIFDRLRRFVRLFKRRDVKVSSRALIHIYTRNNNVVFKSTTINLSHHNTIVYIIISTVFFPRFVCRSYTKEGFVFYRYYCVFTLTNIFV